jgi:hypothetical protein
LTRTRPRESPRPRPWRAREASSEKPGPRALLATVACLAIGGWTSGAIYGLTDTYRAAFLNGIAWNLLNMAIDLWLLLGRLRPPPALARQCETTRRGRFAFDDF